MTPFILLIWMHFFADFVFQTDAMAKNKSVSNRWLAWHVSVYSLIFFIVGWKFALVNACAHFAIDYVTSRVTSRLWKEKQVHWFFVVIGFDQALHLSTLLMTYEYFK